MTARLLEVELIELFEEEIEIEAEAECVSAALGEAQAQGVAHRLSAQAQQHRRPESFLICMWAGAPGLARHDGSSAAAFEAAAAPGRGLRVSVLHVCGLSSS